MTIWQILQHLTKNHSHHPCKYGHFGKLSDRATPLGDTSATFRCPRVPRNTLRQHFRTFSLPEGAAQHSPATLSSLFAARGCRAMHSENYSKSLLSTATSTWILRAIRFVSMRYFLFRIKAKRHLSSTPKSLTEFTLKRSRRT